MLSDIFLLKLTYFTYDVSFFYLNASNMFVYCISGFVKLLQRVHVFIACKVIEDNFEANPVVCLFLKRCDYFLSSYDYKFIVNILIKITITSEARGQEYRVCVARNITHNYITRYTDFHGLY